ncbi:hypothetical protein [Corynebacterium sp. H78]|uniref:hypothetical protein n=1 Tax=Corynebacterium sp. H78 TaxID=3133417 RepID=UPI0030AD36CA
MGEEGTRRPRRKRRRAGAAPEAFASRRDSERTSPLKSENPPPETPEESSEFDEGFWNSERPPHWGSS